MNKVITGSTSVYGIIGSPVSHSLSPVMQNAGFEAIKLDAIYVPWLVERNDLAEAVRGLRALSVSGFNVTIPHKSTIIKYLDEVSDEASVAGAVNTVVNRSGRLIGYNTDGAGLILSLERSLQFTPSGKNIVMLGAGGAARGAVAALSDAGASKISIVNRTLDKAVKIAQDMEAVFKEVLFAAADYEKLQAIIDSADIIINATPMGMNGDDFARLEIAEFKKHVKIYDMVYSTGMTSFHRFASGRGVEFANGLGMLAAQGELAFRLWTGALPPQSLFMETLLNIIKISKP